jgi:hypothetical protein
MRASSWFHDIDVAARLRTTSVISATRDELSVVSATDSHCNRTIASRSIREAS